MDAPKISLLVLLQLLSMSSLIQTTPTNAKIFREYIGAEGKSITFSEVPINPEVDCHFLLSFAINMWVSNAIHSSTRLVKEYSLDGIDVDYEHFNDIDLDTFAECIGKLFFYLKQNNVVAITSIAPYDNDSVMPYYLALWKKYGNLIDMVDFQFYAYEKGTTISESPQYFKIQSSNYEGGKLLVSFGTDKSGGLTPENGFFEVCNTVKKQGKLHGIFIWSADDSKKANFRYEKQSQAFLAA